MQIYGRVEMEYILNFVIIAIEILCLKNFIEIFAEKNKKQYGRARKLIGKYI